MTIIRVVSDQVPEPPPNTFSNCLVVDGQVFISGQCSLGENALQQSRGILSNIKHLMEAAGGSISDVVKFTIYLTDMLDRDQVQQARSEFFAGNFPTSTMIQVSQLVYPSLRVEMEATGVIGGGYWGQS